MRAMFRLFVRLGLFLCILVSARGQTERTQPASEAELAAISARGRALAEYDTAVWHATEAFMAVTNGQDHERVSLYVARKDSDAWEVAYGKLNSSGDKFLIACLVRQTGAPHRTANRARAIDADPVLGPSAARCGESERGTAAWIFLRR